MRTHDLNKAALAPFLKARRVGGAGAIRRAVADIIAPDARLRFCAPFPETQGPNAFWDAIYAPLLSAMPDLEFRDFIVMAGPRWRGTGDWVGVGGNIVGTFRAPWLDIAPTGRPVFLRYHEYYRLVDGQIVEAEAIWDIPQLMIQAGAWPMPVQNGVDWMCPGPADASGVIAVPWTATTADASVKLVWDMLHDLQRGDAETPGRGLGGFWHKDALWFGPSGIGTGRGHDDIVDTVLRDFRTGLADNVRHLDDSVFFGDQNFVAFTGWPSGTATHAADGFLGLAPTGRRFTRRSLDFWRIEDGLIRENWVLVDMIDLYQQLGVDVFARMRAMTRKKPDAA